MRHTYLSQTVWELWPAEDFGFKGDNYIVKTVRVVSFARDTPTGPPLHSYQILSKYVQGYRRYGEHKDASTDGRHADRYIPLTYGSGDKKGATCILQNVTQRPRWYHTLEQGQKASRAEIAYNSFSHIVGNKFKPVVKKVKGQPRITIRTRRSPIHFALYQDSV